MRYKRKEKLWVRKFYRNGEDFNSIRLYPWNWSRKWEPKKCPVAESDYTQTHGAKNIGE
ncbi:hypothetical protein [Brevibacillus laterosporus]|uniref:hypothetical protein n=1 Tax=Brevibacillus laterosporus TaxID=1465 RepID=UPI0015E1BFDD|nr:hypothetical protein [Brevibacillus laterosporus]